MDTNSKQQYMETLREKYFKADRKGKGKILNEYCESAKEERKYAIKKFNYKVKLKKPEERKNRKEYYDGFVKSALVEVWNIFDRPCGQRLKPLIKDEIDIMNDLYRNELRLFKNFFQPVMKLKEKVRIKGKIHRKYDEAKTPYRRIIESHQVDENTKKELKKIYDSLNPAELKRKIDKKISKLYEVYSKKNGSLKVAKNKKLSINLVSYYMMNI